MKYTTEQRHCKEKILLKCSEFTEFVSQIRNNHNILYV